MTLSDPDDIEEWVQHSGGWSPRQAQVAALLSLGMRVNEVAAQANVARETVWRYQQLSGFPELVERLRFLNFERLTDKLWTLGGHAMEVLHEALDEQDTDAALSIFKTIAPGLRDVSQPDGRGSGAPPLPGGAEATASDDDRSLLQCPDCGRTTKSNRGLAQHVRRMH